MYLGRPGKHFRSTIAHQLTSFRLLIIILLAAVPRGRSYSYLPFPLRTSRRPSSSTTSTRRSLRDKLSVSGSSKSGSASFSSGSIKTIDGMELIERRLSNVGAKDYHFVRAEYRSNGNEDKKIETSHIPTRSPPSAHRPDIEPVHVKTLIWEAVLVRPCSSGSGRTIEEVVDHYFVTALRVEDRVDLRRLYDLVKAHTLESPSLDMQSSRRLLLRLAKREVAETLTGYQSGTIPPIAHSTPLPLYIDDVVAKDDSIVASVGSGGLGYDLYIPINEMIRVARLSSATYTSELSIKTRALKKNNYNVQQKDQVNKGINETKSIFETQMANTQGKTARADLLRKAAKKKDNVEVLRRMLEDIGDDFPSLMDVEEYGFGGIDKNALHHAAWKGDLESMTLLIETGKRHGLDLVNRISVGEGNYGKTPVFYSLTQCREDAVLLLIAHGADLLVVNNKGQTPCSIAVSHLKAEICQLLFDVEASQLQAGGSFKNYRRTHSDGRRYGDLDPRFEIDADNMDEDIVSELEAYNQIVKTASGKNRSSSDERYEILQSTMIPGLPRSMRVTTRHWNKPKSQDGGSMMEKRQKKIVGNKSRRIAPKLTSSESAEDAIDYDSLETLALESRVFNKTDFCKVVDDAAGIAELAEVIDKSVAAISSQTSIEKEEMALNDDDVINNSWGLDCEWQPSHTKGHETPVATLQLHHTGTGSSFLIDVQVLLQASADDAAAPMTETERKLSDALMKIFANRQIALLGFGVAMDLGKLAASFPHIPCFRRFENVIDLHSVSRSVYAGSVKTYMSSLQKMVAVLLDMSLDKTEQCSDWEQRPLTRAQVRYALLDAVVLPTLLRAMLCDDSRVTDRYQGIFIQKHPHLRLTTKLSCLGTIGNVDQFACAPQLAYKVPFGSCKIHLQHIMSRQIWTTGKDDPDPPELLPIDVQQSISLSRRPKDKRLKSNEAAEKGKMSKKKKKTLKLSTISADFASLPSPGKVIDYTKDSCIHEILGEAFIESLSDHTRLGFNRRGGVLEFKNAYCLFVNFALSESGGLPSHWLYRNDFLDNGERLTFTVNSDRDQERALMEFFSLHKRSTDAMKVLLFARTSTKAKFMYCGECACTNQVESGNYTNLVLELMNYDHLVVGSSAEPTSAFLVMVASHAAALAEERALAEKKRLLVDS